MNAPGPSRFVRCFVFVVCASFFGINIEAGESPWETIAQYPDDVDAVIVLDNPAERVLLGESGLKSRGILAALGMFTETERAWASLADSFGLEPDEGIRELMSGRVVVLWDRIGEQGNNPLGLIAAADQQWVLVAEIDDDFVRRVRKALKPVPRRIHRNKPVYSIEQGRYQLVVIDPDNDGQRTRMIVSPRAGGGLVDRVIDALVAGGNNPSRLGEGASQIHARVGDGWVLAGAVAVERFLGEEAEQPAVCAVVAWADEDSWKFSVATDLTMDLPEYDAPVALLSAVGGDAVLAMANAEDVRVEPSLISFAPGLSAVEDEGADEETEDSMPIQPGGSLLLITRDTGEHGDADPSPVVTILTGAPGEHGDGVIEVDRVMEEILTDSSTGDSPAFNGRFPRAIRTQTKPAVQDEEEPDEWWGEEPQISWVCMPGRDRDEMVLSMGAQGAGTARWVRWIVEASSTLAVIPDAHQELGVLSRGFVKPIEFASLAYPDQGGLVSMLGGGLERIDWDLRRAPFGVAGTADVRWAPGNTNGRLGGRER